ncbi:hypothetical protein OH76DRAFT_1354415, partial [Lentinus brumalis]
VVWWRACVLWPANRAVRLVCMIMILLTISMHLPSLASTFQATYGDMLIDDLWGIITGLSSLLTNIIATTLIAYRAWQHRRTIMTYLRASRRTQVERTLALLVESGLLYCALWVSTIL